MARVILFSYIEYMHSCLSSSVQLLSHVWLFVTPWITARQASLSITNSRSSNPCPSSQWCHPAISSSVVPFSSCPQSLPASGAFPMSQLFTWGGQSIAVSASASVLPMNTQDWSPLGWTGWISLQSKGLKSLLQHHSSKASIIWCSAFFTVQLSHPYMTTGKTIALTKRTCLSRRRVIMVARCQSGKATWKNVRWLSFKSYKGSFGVTDFFFFSVTVPAPISHK